MSYPEYDIDIDETVEDFTDDYEYQAYPSEKAQQQQYYGDRGRRGSLKDKSRKKPSQDSLIG